QLLHQVAGVQIESVSGGAGRSIIRIHGSSANQVLVLLDGQRLNNPQTGEVDLSEIPLEQIERIEVVRQGNTAIFGGNAFGGVISFKSRRVENQNNFSLRS
ncbi:MAG: TonB-dependent receptor plug domain-containing protein, partial [Aliifodinibius sp.]|nr:TonB-dependent receptor plug domain-containing protein [Fodinibius sp.]NIV12702.1 TonB-dependent receptor plug domain-containing protein [Fodinibius sp.]NIY26402.1 TonB-dependent receptor plug domain-containing protein [Fodinibius sp.]